MSLSFQHLEPVCVRDPVTILDNKRAFAVVKSGSQNTWKAWTSTSVSQTAIQFSAPPPSGSVIMDRKIYFYLPARLSFTGIPPNGQTLLNVNRDAPRQYPIAGSIETIQATINNQSISFNCADVIHALMWYNNNVDLKNGGYSMTPNMPDQFQNYSDGFGTIRSPLQNYGDSLDETVMNRGGFPFTVITNPISNGVNAVTATVDVAFCEPIFMSPLHFGKDNKSGFYNVNAFDLSINFVNQLANRMWSHDNNGGTNVITSSSVVLGSLTGGPQSFNNLNGNQPLLLINYITPQETQILSPNMPISYPYFDILRFSTDAAAVAANGTTTMVSNNVQLSSIPRRMYIYVREKNANLYSNADRPDTYFQINAINLQFLNKSGLLASARMVDLYKMSVANHYNGSYTQWSGGKVYRPGTWASQVGTVGSVLCLEFATQIGLDSLDCPGKLLQSTLQVTLNVTNVSDRTIEPSLYIVPVLEGEFVITQLGSASTRIGIVSSKDILDCQQSPFISYADVQHVNGGDFFSGLKDFMGKIGSFFKDNKIISSIAKSPLLKGIDMLTGLPVSQIGQTIGNVAESYGYGEGEGVLIGGRSLKRSQLKRRLH